MRPRCVFVREFKSAFCLVTFVMSISVGSLVSATGHESWISKGRFKNGDNEWCCGANDCVAIPGERVRVNGIGYDLILDRTETVPYAETLPSQDGQYWRCHRTDGSRRCFFAPQPGM
jgi:hypothetical protein